MGHFARDCKSSRNHKCEKCGRAGHFAVCCHTKQKDDQQPSGGEQQHRQGGGRQKNHYRGHGYTNAVSSELALQGGGDVEPATSDYCKVRNIGVLKFSELIQFSILANRNISV